MLAKGDVKKIDQIDNAGRKSIAVYIFTDSLEKPFIKKNLKTLQLNLKKLRKKVFHYSSLK
jgi:hypothetical protein